MTAGSRRRRAHVIAARAAGALACGATSARASLFTGDTLDAVANGAAWVILVIVPIIVIAVFWIVHVLPEKIAHKNHHPQYKAIQTLCLLSLVFGGLLWPIAWIWAYTRPIAYKLAYGTDKHDEYFDEMGEKARSGEALAHEVDALKHELDVMRSRGKLPPHLERLREDLASFPIANDGAPVAPTAAELERRGA